VVAKDALRVLHNQYKDTGIEIAEDYERGMPTVQGNFANLGQVVLNIIKNAIQAVDPDAGRILLNTRWSSENSQLVFTCHDNGPGVAAVIRRDVFKPFFTTKPVGQGTGLGLYICHEIIRKHGGAIELESDQGRGTVVKVSLPVDREGL
jgi:two-component system NtrC family sensor kinase